MAFAWACLAMAVTTRGFCLPYKRRLLHLAFCSCSLLWLPDGLPVFFDVPASLADFRARRRARFRASPRRSSCALRLPLLCPMRDPRNGPDSLPSMNQFMTMAGNAVVAVVAVAPALEDSAPGSIFRKTLPGALSWNEGLGSRVSMQNANLDLYGSRWL